MVQLQSTLPYPKTLPAGYQQSGVDALDELAEIQKRIDFGYYTNQYYFEADFQLSTYTLNDGHVLLTARAQSAFSFSAPFEMVLVSADRKQPPNIYFTGILLQPHLTLFTDHS